MSTGHRTIKGLGEIALRVEDLDTMQRFYEEVIGLELIKRFDNAAFLKLADGYDGHTQVLALKPATWAWIHSRPALTTSPLRSAWRISRPRKTAWSDWDWP
jgi:catechol 2,3-dioxygenase-like lactoylglutathione lyase family enzyme